MPRSASSPRRRMAGYWERDRASETAAVDREIEKSQIIWAT